MKILILACSARKMSCDARAMDMYQGAIFRKGIEIAKRQNLHPFILSAKYGLINWDKWIEPYDQKMKGGYRGPWPEGSGYYLGGQLYFKHVPDRFKPLVPSGTIGYMLQNLNRLLLD